MPLSNFSWIVQISTVILTVLFGYYAFFNYKKYVKRQKLRVAIHTELNNAKSDARMSYENLDSLNDVSLFDYGKSAPRSYDANMDKLHLLTDAEVNAIVLAYDRLEQYRQNLQGKSHSR